MTPNGLVKKKIVLDARADLEEAAVSLGSAMRTTYGKQTNSVRALARRRVIDTALEYFKMKLRADGIEVE